MGVFSHPDCSQLPAQLRGVLLALVVTLLPLPCLAADPVDPETVLRLLVRANADRDLATMSRYMAHEADAIGYTIGGRKYLGWTDFAADMQHEFDSVTRIEIPIQHLQLWTRGDIAWFAMELDYIRYVQSGGRLSKTLLPLRETGVLENRDGTWTLVAWHESSRANPLTSFAGPPREGAAHLVAGSSPQVNGSFDLSGEWEVNEEDKTYRAALDREGNGPYTHQGGRFVTTKFFDRRWEGTWHQTGNDREGGFDLLLSEDGTEAKGVWWYTRVGDRNNIPPRRWGGTYVWKRLTPPPVASSQ
jgi:hypothetical protein